MSGQFTKFIGLFLALSLLGGCTRTPSRLILGVINDYPPSVSEGVDTYCTDALEASLILQDTKVESDLISPGNTISIDLIVPEGAGPGSILTAEARCYREGQEVGYALVEKPYQAPRIPTVSVLAPPSEGTSDFDCVVPTEARGVPICIRGDPYN